MPTQLDKSMILTGLPLVWIAVIDKAGDDPDKIEWLWGFQTAKKVGYKINLPSQAASSGDKAEVVLCDGTKLQYGKKETLIDLVTETETTDPTKDPEATGFGEISFEAGSAPKKYETSAFVSGLGWTEWLKALQGYLDRKFLVIVPTGVTEYSRYSQGTKVADGYAYMIAKLSSGIEQELSGNAASLSLSFVSYKDTTIGLANAISTLGASIPPLKIHGGGGSKDLEFTPDALDNDPVNTDSDYLMLGKVLLKNITYTW